MTEQHRFGLPGLDYVLAGVNISLDAWSRRTAVYHDIGRAKRALLAIHCWLSVKDSTRITPHGFRHLGNGGSSVAKAGPRRQVRPGYIGPLDPKLRKP